MKKRKIALIIQARMGSSRLPGKVMMKVLEKPILELMVERMALSKYIDEIVIATTQTSGKIMEWFYQYRGPAQKNKKLSLFVGSENDVLRRTCGAAIQAQADVIVDVTSDCPLCDPKHIDAMLKNLPEEQFYHCNIAPRLWPDGFDFQIYDAALLYKAEYTTFQSSPHREHSGWNILQKIKHGLQIHFSNLAPEKPYHQVPAMRLTLDYLEDFYTIRNVINHLITWRCIDKRAEDIIDLIITNPYMLQNREHENKPFGDFNMNDLLLAKKEYEQGGKIE